MSVDALTIERATLEDLDVLVEFNRRMAEETEDKGLNVVRLRQGVARVLEDERRGFYLVARRQGGVCGQLMVTTEWSDWRDGWFWWIQSVYVTAPHRRTGVYRALHEQVRELADRTGDVCGIRLYVEKENAGAQATYRRLGMTETGYRLYETDWSRDD